MGRWCSVTLGGGTGRSCWPRYSRVRSPTGESDRGGAAGTVGGGGGGRQHEEPGRRRTEVGASPSSLCAAYMDEVYSN